MALTLATILTSVRDLLNESTAAFYTDAEITRWITQATLDISTVAQCIETTTTVTMVTSTPTYALPAPTVDVKHVVWTPTRQALRKITPSLQGEAATDLEDDQPLRWYVWGTQLYVEPLPSVTAAGQEVIVYYAYASQDVTLLPDSYQLLAIWYATMMGCGKNKQYAAMASYFSLYANGLAYRKVDIQQREPQTEVELKQAMTMQPVGRQGG